MEVRLDKWLQVARLFKTRSQATRAIALNRVRVNGQRPKAHRNVQLEDRIEVEHGDWTRIVIVKGIRERPVPKAEARELIEDISPPRPKLSTVERIMRQPAAKREKGKGRPTKKERRKIADWEGWE
ncbi:MAG TPA: S4 domain-containing protein [Acidobacteriota bacterium]|nr:S4 domain-containing protein [Acidobacteriota bacterium]